MNLIMTIIIGFLAALIPSAVIIPYLTSAASIIPALFNAALAPTAELISSHENATDIKTVIQKRSPAAGGDNSNPPAVYELFVENLVVLNAVQPPLFQLQCASNSAVAKITFIDGKLAIYCVEWSSVELAIGDIKSSTPQLISPTVQSARQAACPEGMAVSGVKCNSAECAQYQLYCSRYTATVKGRPMPVQFTKVSTHADTSCPSEQIIIGTSLLGSKLQVNCAMATLGIGEFSDPCSGRKRQKVEESPADGGLCLCLADPPPPPSLSGGAPIQGELFITQEQVDSGQYSCLDTRDKYPIAELLNQEPPSTFRYSTPSIHGAIIGQTFLALYEIMEKGESGSFGSTFRIKSRIDFIEATPERVLKVFQTENGQRELEIGLIVSEQLIDTQLSSNYMKVYDYFHCDIKEILYQAKLSKTGGEGVDSTCLIMEYVPGLQISKFSLAVGKLLYVTNGIDRIIDWTRSLLFQVLQALKIGWEHIKFSHLDLHLGNLLLDRKLFGTDPVPSNQYFIFQIDGKVYRVPKLPMGGAKIKFIDYGWAGLLYNGEMILSESKNARFYKSNEGPRVDVELLVKSLKSMLGRPVWESINDVLDDQFREILWLASIHKADPNIYSKLLAADLFKVYLLPDSDGSSSAACPRIEQGAADELDSCACLPQQEDPGYKCIKVRFIFFSHIEADGVGDAFVLARTLSLIVSLYQFARIKVVALDRSSGAKGFQILQELSTTLGFADRVRLQLMTDSNAEALCKSLAPNAGNRRAIFIYGPALSSEFICEQFERTNFIEIYDLDDDEDCYGLKVGFGMPIPRPQEFAWMQNANFESRPLVPLFNVKNPPKFIYMKDSNAIVSFIEEISIISAGAEIETQLDFIVFGNNDPTLARSICASIKNIRYIPNNGAQPSSPCPFEGLRISNIYHFRGLSLSHRDFTLAIQKSFAIVGLTGDYPYLDALAFDKIVVREPEIDKVNFDESLYYYYATQLNVNSKLMRWIKNLRNKDTPGFVRQRLVLTDLPVMVAENSRIIQEMRTRLNPLERIKKVIDLNLEMAAAVG